MSLAFVILLAAFCSCQGLPSAIELWSSVQEELPIGTVVIDLSTTEQLTGIQDLSYTILVGLEDFSITGSGQVVTSAVLDRESLCDKQSQVVDDCKISLDIMCTASTSQFIMAKLHIKILDIDDNTPLFPESDVMLNVSEADDLNVTFSLPLAIDADSSNNTSTSYEIYSVEPEIKGFQLRWTEDQLDLQFTGSLDAEDNSVYSLTIIAYSPSFSDSFSSLNVRLNVEDINDNRPQFDQSVYRVSLSESAVVGTEVLLVIAHDSDVSDNVVSYKLKNTKGSQRFSIDSVTGLIIVIGALDYENKSSHLLEVIATDSSAIPRFSTAIVHVELTDYNDFAPKITITSVSRDSLPKVAEHSGIGTFVAHIAVSDADSTFPNNDIVCHTSSDIFSLNPLYNKEFSLTVNGDIDREAGMDNLDVVIECKDQGLPAKTSTVMLSVEVEDINDHLPEFPDTVYHIYHIAENEAAGSFVIQITAIDRDAGANAAIEYKLMDVESEQELSSHFQVDSETGEITTTISLDYELVADYNFYLVAADKGIPASSSSTLINVHVIDMNDNKPIFTQSEYKFTIVEEQQIQSDDNRVIIGQVLANDKDGKGEAEVWYKLDGSDGLFEMDAATGEVYTRQRLDREEQVGYTLEVTATDFGMPALSSKAKIRIEVRDINDNPPHFVTKANSTFRTSYQSRRGDVVTELSASDPDSTDLKNLKYYLVAGPSLFHISELSGKLVVAEDLTQNSIGSYALHISVTDSTGNSDFLEVIVTVTSDIISEQLEDNSESLSSTAEIVIGTLVCVVLLATGLMVLACFKVRQYKAQHKNRYNCRIAAEYRSNSSRCSSTTPSSGNKNSCNSSVLSELTEDSIMNSVTRSLTARQNVHSILSISNSSHLVPPQTYIKRHPSINGAFSILTDSGCGSLSTPIATMISPQTYKQYQPKVCCRNLVPYNMTLDTSNITSVSQVQMDESTHSPIKSQAVNDMMTDTTSDVFNLDDAYSFSENAYCKICQNDSIVSWSHNHSFQHSNDNIIDREVRTPPIGQESIV